MTSPVLALVLAGLLELSVAYLWPAALFWAARLPLRRPYRLRVTDLQRAALGSRRDLRAARDLLLNEQELARRVTDGSRAANVAIALSGDVVIGSRKPRWPSLGAVVVLRGTLEADDLAVVPTWLPVGALTATATVLMTAYVGLAPGAWADTTFLVSALVVLVGAAIVPFTAYREALELGRASMRFGILRDVRGDETPVPASAPESGLRSPG